MIAVNIRGWRFSPDRKNNNENTGKFRNIDITQSKLL